MRVWINSREDQNEIIADAQVSSYETIPGETEGEDTIAFIGIIVINGVEYDVNVELERKEVTE
jgi:hypothetical protein